MAAAAIGLAPDGFAAIARALPMLDLPVRIIYGEHDRVLADIGDTVARLKSDLPTVVDVTALPCGHFLQEEAPDEVGELLAAFLAG